MRKWKELSKDKIFLLLLVGVILFLISFPLEQLGKNSSKQSSNKTQTELTANAYSGSLYCEQLEQELESLLENVAGAGKVKVMLVLADTGEKIVEKDQQTESRDAQTQGDSASSEKSSTIQENTVMEAGETPWISREIMPEIAGIAVVAEGGDSAVIQSQISSLLQALFGLPAHKIKVLKGEF